MTVELELAATVATLTRIVESLAAKLDHELAELRVAVEEIDYATVKRGPFEELHTRVDELEHAAWNPEAAQ